MADRIGVSDKAVSKWERGIGLPDTSIIGKIAILLDSDTDSLLAGDVIHNNVEWTGLLFLKDESSEIHADTIIYDKPVINIMLSYFMLMGIRNIRIVCGRYDNVYINNRFGDGAKYGLKLECCDNIGETDYIENDGNVMIITGITFIFGVDQSRFFQKAMLEKNRTTILSLPKKRIESPSRIYFDSDKKIVTSDAGEKMKTQYDYYQLPIIFCPAKNIMKLKFEDVVMLPYTKNNEEIYTVVLDRGFVEIPINTWDDVMDVSSFVKTVQRACGMEIYCIEEIAWRRGLISHKQFVEFGKQNEDTSIGKYILEIAGEK